MRAQPRHSPALPIQVALAAVLLSGCAVGPDYMRPTLADAGRQPYVSLPRETAAAPISNGEAQRLQTTRDVAPDWWRQFGSAPLNTLIEQSLKAHPSIESLHAALRVAEENVAAQEGSFYPTLSASYTPSRTKVAGNLGGNSPGVQQDGSVISTYSGTPANAGGTAPFNAPVIYTFHTAQLTVGYAPDLFGANRRQVEALQAQAGVQRCQLLAARLMLASNIAAAAVQDAMLRRQLDSVRENIRLAEQVQMLLQRQMRAGYASRLDLATGDGALAQARSALPQLVKQFEQNRNLLRSITVGAPDRALPAFDLDAIQLPADLPLRLPSQLVASRPDVRAAEEQLHAASAQVGIARASRLPQFSIDGSYGGAAGHASQMFSSGGKFFDLALNITQPLFDGGTLLHRERAAREALRQAAADYQTTVLGAFRNVADALHALDADAEALKTAADSLDAAQRTLVLTRRRHERGFIDRAALLNAEQAYQQGLQAAAQARAARFSDTIALFVSLGGSPITAPDSGPASDTAPPTSVDEQQMSR